MPTRRQWLFQNPPPQTAERFSFDLRDAKEELRAAMAETGAVVLEMFAAQAVKPQKKTSFFEWRKERKKLLEAAKSVAQIVKRDKASDAHAFEQQGDQLVKRLEEFQIETSRELVHALTETRLWRQKIAQLKEKVESAAKCPIDGADLMRTGNRKEDLFVCTAPIVEDRSQHYFLWTLVDGEPGLRAVDLAKDALPDIDGPMEGL